jgi:hypothetical protein
LPDAGIFSADQLADALNANRVATLAGLPGFVEAEQAVTESMTRRRALENM